MRLLVTPLFRTCRGVLFLVLLASVMPVAAEPAGAYGRYFVRAGSSWPSEAAPVPPVMSEPALGEDIESLLARLEDLEAQQGPYSAVLSEPLGDLARALESVGRYGEAEAYRDRALHLLRVNEGLYSPLQVPLVRAQLLSDRRRGDYAAVDARYDYYHRLFGNGLPPYTPLRFAATLEYFRWQREALRRELDGDPLRRLGELLRGGDELLASLAETTGPAADALRRDAVLNQLRNYYLFADMVTPRPDLEPWSPAAAPFGSDLDEFDMQRDRLENRRRALRSRGDALLGELLEEASDLDATDRALLWRERGDWAQWWGASRSAAEHYRRSWDALVAAGDDALAATWFAEPRPLPDNGVFVDPGLPVAGAAELQLEVSERGEARASLRGISETMPREVQRLPRQLRAIRFRPALRDGIPVEMVLDSWPVVAFE